MNFLPAQTPRQRMQHTNLMRRTQSRRHQQRAKYGAASTRAKARPNHDEPGRTFASGKLTANSTAETNRSRARWAASRAPSSPPPDRARACDSNKQAEIVSNAVGQHNRTREIALSRRANYQRTKQRRTRCLNEACSRAQRSHNRHIKEQERSAPASQRRGRSRVQQR